MVGSFRKDLRTEEGAGGRPRDPHTRDSEVPLEIRPVAGTGDPAVDHLCRHGSGGVTRVHPDVLRDTEDGKGSARSIEAVVEAVMSHWHIAARHPFAMLPRERIEHRVGGQAPEPLRLAMAVDKRVDLLLQRGDRG